MFCNSDCEIHSFCWEADDMETQFSLDLGVSGIFSPGKHCKYQFGFKERATIHTAFLITEKEKKNLAYLTVGKA